MFKKTNLAKFLVTSSCIFLCEPVKAQKVFTITHDVNAKVALRLPIADDVWSHELNPDADELFQV